MDAILRPTNPARMLQGRLELDAARHQCPNEHGALRSAPACALPLSGPVDAWNAARDVNG